MTVQRLGAHVNVFPPPAKRPLHSSALQRCAAPACCSRCTTQSSLLGTCAGTCRWAGQRGWVTVVDSLGLADRKFGSRQPCNASRSGCCRLAAPHTAAGGRPPPPHSAVPSLPCPPCGARHGPTGARCCATDGTHSSGQALCAGECSACCCCCARDRCCAFAGFACCWQHVAWRLQLFS